MNILHLTNKLPYPPTDGGTIAVYTMMQGLAQWHQVSLFAINTSKHYQPPEKTAQGMPFLQHFHAEYLKTGHFPVALLANLLFSRQPYNYQQFYHTRIAKALKKFLQQHPFDIVQLEGLYLMSYLPLIRQFSNARIVLRAHNLEHEIWQRAAQREKHLLKKMYLHLLARRLRRLQVQQLNTYDALVPITPRDAQALQSIGNQKPIHVAPTGITAADYTPTRPNNKPSLCYIGALDWFPNQEGLLWFVEQVWPAVHNEFPQVQLHVAGRNAPNWLAQRLQQPGIVYQGEIPHAIDFMHQHPIMVVPLFSGSGMRIKLIEGLAAGRAIVTTPIGKEGLDAQDEEHLFCKNTPKEQLAVIRLLLQQPQQMQAIAKAGRQWVSTHFDNQAITGQLSSFYKTLSA